MVSVDYSDEVAKANALDHMGVAEAKGPLKRTQRNFVYNSSYIYNVNGYVTTYILTIWMSLYPTLYDDEDVLPTYWLLK